MKTLIRKSWCAVLMVLAVDSSAQSAPSAVNLDGSSLRHDPSGHGAVDVPGDWWRTVSDRIANDEYRASRCATELQAPNRAQGLRTYFRPGGIDIVPRTDERGTETWRWTWRTIGWGREGRMQTIETAPTDPRSEGTRVIYAHSGFHEWYENGREGLEQGFTLERCPPGGGPVRLEARLGGALCPSQTDPATVDFIDANGALVLRYAQLHAWDARGCEIPAGLEFHEQTLAIVLDDREALYPITIDPLMTSPAWTAESNQTISRFGTSVATAGDVNGDGFSDVIVGANLYDNGQIDEGRAFVFHGSASGLSLAPDWTAESDQANAQFGGSVAPAGDVNGDGFGDIVVGAYLFDGGEPNEGRVFVYHGSAAGISPTVNWSSECDQAGAAFGLSATTAGDLNGDGFSDVVVGAPFFDNAETDEGRTFVYYGSAVGLSFTANWTAESNQANASFGYSVATAGDVNGDGYSDVIVGALSFDNGQSDEGRAYIYHGSSGGLSLTAAWTAESDQVSANFGWKVSTAGDVNGDGFSDVIVSARYYYNPEFNEGRAYVYHGSASGLSLAANWTAEANQVAGEFASSVSTAGDVNADGFSDVIVGGRYLHNGQTNEGRAFVYQGGPSGLSFTANWTGESDQNDAEYGTSVATAGDVNGDGFSDVIVGAPRFDNGQNDEGRAFVYYGAGSGLDSLPNWTRDGPQAGALFGLSVAAAGDVNGDGYGDVIIGATQYDNGQTEEGGAFVYHGSATGLSLTPIWTVESNQDSSFFGWSVATAGDVNGDGFSDVLVGAPGFSNGEGSEGRSFVYYGSPGGLSPTPNWTAESDQAVANFGIHVATAGDVNGDGFADVIVGAHRYTNGETNEGRAFAYYGSASGLSLTPSWTGESDQPGTWFGFAVGTAGDVNGDGFSDVIIGAYNYQNPEFKEGRAFVYHGSASGLGVTANWTAESNQTFADLGWSVGSAGDVNGDGFSDVIVGALYYSSDQSREGRAFVYHGSVSGLGAVPAWSAEGDLPNANFGSSVATAGDVNGDGFSDVVVGALYFSNGQQYEGRALLYHGSASGLSLAANWTAEGEQDTANFGYCVATAGDVNGDGFSDVIVSAPKFNTGGPFPPVPVTNDGGRVYLYYGNGEDGLDYNPRQLRADGSGPIGLLGLSDSPSSFRLAANARTAAGRGDVRLQWEVEPLGTPFDGVGIVTGSRIDTGTPSGFQTMGVESELVSGLTPGTAYHWGLRVVGDSPFFPHSLWLSMPGNAVTETDLRTASGSTGVGRPSPVTARLWLEEIAPNPFATLTRLVYTLPAQGRVRLAIYDIAGREVAVVTSVMRSPGRYTSTWDAKNARGGAVRDGVYFARLEFAGRTEARKIVLAR